MLAKSHCLMNYQSLFWLVWMEKGGRSLIVPWMDVITALSRICHSVFCVSFECVWAVAKVYWQRQWAVEQSKNPGSFYRSSGPVRLFTGPLCFIQRCTHEIVLQAWGLTGQSQPPSLFPRLREFFSPYNRGWVWRLHHGRNAFLEWSEMINCNKNMDNTFNQLDWKKKTTLFMHLEIRTYSLELSFIKHQG